MRTKAVIFDFGFTLYAFKEPSVEKFFECFNKGLLKSVDLLKKMNIFQDETTIKEFIKVFNKKKTEYFKLSVKTKKEYTTSYIFREVLNSMNNEAVLNNAKNLTERDYDDLATLFHSFEEEEWIPFEETRQTLERIRKLEGIKIALISNHPHHKAIKNMLRKYDLLDLFDIVVTSAKFGRRKPDPEIFLHTLKQIDLKGDTNQDVNSCIMCGDEYADIVGAQRAGIRTILCERTFKFPFEKEIDQSNLIKIKRISEILTYID